MAVDRIKLLIAHKSPLVSAGLEAAFRTQGDFEVVSCTAESGRPPPAETQLGSVNVAVADCETGIHLVVPASRNGCRVLIVTQDESEASIRRAVELGVRGYLLLTSSLESVVRAVRCISHGGTALDPLVTTKMVASLTGRPLTHRELDVLRLMMLGLSDKAIARRLARSVGTAKTHVKAILAKLDSASRLEAVVVARRRGLVPEASVVSVPEHDRGRIGQAGSAIRY